jgi:hypothetical protein
VLRLLGARFACAAKQIPVLLKVTCGIWDDESVTTMHIVEDAEEYDDADEDDDNCHQVVLQVRGQGEWRLVGWLIECCLQGSQQTFCCVISNTRFLFSNALFPTHSKSMNPFLILVVGLIWMYIPALTILAKLAELLNETPLWTNSCDRLALIEPLALRRAKWILNALKFLILFAVSVAPRNVSALLVLYMCLSAASAILPHIPVCKQEAENATVKVVTAQELQMVPAVRQQAAL